MESHKNIYTTVTTDDNDLCEKVNIFLKRDNHNACALYVVTFTYVIAYVSLLLYCATIAKISKNEWIINEMKIVSKFVCESHKFVRIEWYLYSFNDNDDCSLLAAFFVEYVVTDVVLMVVIYLNVWMDFRVSHYYWCNLCGIKLFKKFQMILGLKYLRQTRHLVLEIGKRELVTEPASGI